MSFSLSGRVALVTGSSTGLGKAIALAFGEAGAKVAVNYHNNRERAETTMAEFTERGITCELFRDCILQTSLPAMVGVPDDTSK